MRFVQQCPICGKRMKANTRTVLDQVVSEHVRVCAERCAKALEAARAKAKQGELF